MKVVGSAGEWKVDYRDEENGPSEGKNEEESVVESNGTEIGPSAHHIYADYKVFIYLPIRTNPLYL